MHESDFIQVTSIVWVKGRRGDRPAIIEILAVGANSGGGGENERKKTYACACLAKLLSMGSGSTLSCSNLSETKS